MISREFIIDKVLTDKKIQHRLNTIQSEFKDDFIQDFYIILLEYPIEKLRDVYNNEKLENFCSTIIRKNIKSNKSGFYKKYIKDSLLNNTIEYDFLESVDNKDKINNLKLISDIEQILDTKIYWYDAHLFRLYYLHIIDEETSELMSPMSLRGIQKYHNDIINYNSIRERNLETMVKIINILLGDKKILKSDLSEEWLCLLDKKPIKRRGKL